jgi:hypothetical protein
MKKYIKNGIIKNRNQIVIKSKRIITDKKNNEKEVITNIYNPKESDLLAAGWVEYVTPVYEDTIEDVKRDKIHEIKCYDSSTSINEFFLGETSIWLDKATRAGLKLRFEAEVSLGKDTTTLWYNNIQYSLELTKAIQMLLAIEVYASACYDNTQNHLANVSKLSTIEDIKYYDYTGGYPEKLRFE